MRPLIGISQCRDERGRIRAGRTYQYLDSAYAVAVVENGGLPVYLPVESGTELASRIDGLLLPGGGDFAPERAYPAGVDFDLAPDDLVAFDRALLDAALERDIPVFGICYGMQLLALRFGGALHHDLPTDRPDAAAHSLPAPGDRHPLELDPGSRLADLLGDADGGVNSRHHQAVSDPGALRVSARAPDGLIEAVERDGTFCLGVQWHPEGMPAAHRDRLFGPFVAACTAGSADT